MTNPAETSTNQRVIDAIAEALENGLQHPGNPKTQQPAAAILPSTFRTRGYPPHIADSIRANNRTIAESIIHLIENQCECAIVPKAGP